MTAQNQPHDFLYPLTHLAIIEVNGQDASQFLQGQLTCNINELSLQTSSIAAFCNAKGRVISTLLVIKTHTGFFLILPADLVDIVLKKLRIYILRAKVRLDKPDKLSLIGLMTAGAIGDTSLLREDFECSQTAGLLIVKMPFSTGGFLCIAPATDTTALEKLPVGELAEWRFWEISSGFPWFAAAKSEQYIPQMLNIDQLGGISFNKGCYTGQEVVARTHYLGKAKRHLYLAECDKILPPDSDYAIKDADSGDKCGEILCLESSDGITRLLTVLQTVDDTTKNLILDDSKSTAIKLIPANSRKA
ncbi:folate-binding protein [Methylomonas sp. SURF-2]|uniref:Folate-binding protein n=1 Tax=Methylomonas subterranea TaxID=2952225 RepID=A0ABT1TAM5_9GAMM|nr:folate-binding protein [Methylomonas sp. SURF-2]MCQ8102522.1 folate-binding protein [Methylomonas sp. SURF-2]